MPTKRAPTALHALLPLLRREGVTEYEAHPDGRPKRVVFAPRAVTAAPVEEPAPARGAKPEKPRAPEARYDAVALAVRGLDYDPSVDDVEPAEGEAH